MIESIYELQTAIGMAWLEKPLRSRKETKVRVYLNGRYAIEEVRVSPDDGAIVLWLDERGEQEQ